MKKEFPQDFLERLKDIVPEKHYPDVVASFSQERMLSVRINTLKINCDDCLAQLEERNISYAQLPWLKETLIINEESRDGALQTDLFDKGYVYRQSLASMLPVLVLDPKRDERVLDLCAAPGSKTSQIAAVMGNTGRIVANDAVKGRYFKLKAVAALLGVTNTAHTLVDGRKFRLKPGEELFDKILVDAPCSGEGRFKTFEQKSYAYWSPRKIKEMVRKQRGLLLTASRLLKPGGTLVYSTCTFAPEENEGVIDWLMRKTESDIVLDSVELKGFPSYAPVAEWGEKLFDQQINRCFRVLPGKGFEGFFIAKMIKKESS